MAEKITDKQVADLLAALRSDASIDAKVEQVTALKSGIKQHNVPDSCVAPAFEALRTASASQHAALVNAGFTALGHLLTRLSRQEPKLLAKEAARTLPLIVEKLGDQKEKLRALASQDMTMLWAVAPADVERAVRYTAMAGKNPRAKEASMQWLLQVHRENGLPFRSYVPNLMELLEDADGMVRDAAKTTVIELFRNAPNTAKSDLKRQLKSSKVRPAIEQAIVKELAPTASAPTPEPADSAPAPSRLNLSASVSSLPAAAAAAAAEERPGTPVLESRPEAVEPSYVNTQRELDEILRAMHAWFEGRETEQNWLKREESMTKLRQLLAGNAPSDFPDALLTGLRALLDGIIKAISSLRTSLSKEGCSLVQEMAMAYGPGMDPMVELLMQTFIKLSAGTKKISSQLANATVDIIIGKVTYSARIMQHVWGACQDKNVQPRTYTAGWLRTLLKKEAHHKNHLEHTGGLDLIEKCIKKGLADPNPGVREKMRGAYWAFAGVWPARAEVIMDGLEATAQRLLQKDPNNPNSPQKPDQPVRPGMGLSKSTMGGGPPKPSLRETMLAQKRATLTAARNLPARPVSAMAHISPVRTASDSNTTSATSTSAAPTTRQRPESKLGVASGGLSGAPMRPTRKRPDVVARPATAGPYSVRSHDHASTEASSPPEKPRTRAAATPKAMQASPKRTVPMGRPGHVATASESSLPSPSRLQTAKPAPARVSPGKPTPVAAPSALQGSSPSRAHEDFTLVVPSVAAALATQPSAAQSPFQPAREPIAEPESTSTTPSKPLRVYEDPFTERDQTTPRPTLTGPVLGDKPVNEDAAKLVRPEGDGDENGAADSPMLSPERAKQNARLLDSGIAKVKAQSLDVHGFRRLQGIIRDNKAPFTDDKFEALLTGLFGYLESPLAILAPEKAQDVKAQILATIRLLLRKARDNFQPHVSRGLESLLATRAAYDARTHIVSGLELLADDLAALGDAPEIVVVLTRLLQGTAMDTPGCRTLSMGLHVLRSLIDARASYQPSEAELGALAALAGRCLESAESGVRMDAVQVCVALHARVGDAAFWEVSKGVKDDPKSLITYYIVKRQREAAAA